MGARFSSILYPGDAEARPPEASTAPDCFHDLGLDQIVEAIIAGRQEYDLAPFFYTPLHELDAVAYRGLFARTVASTAVPAVIIKVAAPNPTTGDTPVQSAPTATLETSLPTPFTVPSAP